MSTFPTQTTVMLIGVLALGGCGDSGDTASTPGEAVTDRTAEPAEPSSQSARPATGTDPAREAGSPDNALGQADTGAQAIDTTVIDGNGAEVGTLTVEPTEQGVRLALIVQGLTPGPHAVHFHQHGRCDPPEFQSAGDHFNPHDAPHGMPDMDEDAEDQDHHVGDMLNQDVDDQGRLNTVMVNHMATLDDGPNSLLDEDGSALVIHADPDDYESQPSGNAGGRVACAVVSRSEMSGAQS